MEDENKIKTRWERRDAKQQAKKRFSSDNRRSIRWLYWNSGQKTHAEHSNEDTSSGMLSLRRIDGD